MVRDTIGREQTLGEQVLATNGQMEDLAAAGEWLNVMDLLVRRDALICKLVNGEQTAVVLASRQSTERIFLLAETAHRDVAGKLASLKRGRQATNSYRLNT